MALVSTSRYWAKLLRRTVRPSWVASQAAVMLGANVVALTTVSPRALLPLAVTMAAPGVTVRKRVGRHASVMLAALRRVLLVVMYQPERPSSKRGSLDQYWVRQVG